ncbi:hypothetical protein [Pontibacter ruber]|uniref:Uncharacterized protein n=1 Tax=Pontibacter ruber TaxID=1343895 RepID=A0ABW5CV66_9BACT|nr:hypothetical protein [Pontibacter ruber]
MNFFSKVMLWHHQNQAVQASASKHIYLVRTQDILLLIPPVSTSFCFAPGKDKVLTPEV